MTFDALAHARRTLRSARLLLDDGDPASAASRAYYAALYVVRAALAVEGSRPKTHTGALREFGRLFVQPGRLPSNHADVFGRAMQYRELADYVEGPYVDGQEVATLIHEVNLLVDALTASVNPDA